VPRGVHEGASARGAARLAARRSPQPALVAEAHHSRPSSTAVEKEAEKRAATTSGCAGKAMAVATSTIGLDRGCGQQERERGSWGDPACQQAVGPRGPSRTRTPAGAVLLSLPGHRERLVARQRPREERRRHERGGRPAHEHTEHEERQCLHGDGDEHRRPRLDDGCRRVAAQQRAQDRRSDDDGDQQLCRGGEPGARLRRSRPRAGGPIGSARELTLPIEARVEQLARAITGHARTVFRASSFMWQRQVPCGHSTAVPRRGTAM
jgi:hypothetical protein